MKMQILVSAVNQDGRELAERMRLPAESILIVQGKETGTTNGSAAATGFAVTISRSGEWVCPGTTLCCGPMGICACFRMRTSYIARMRRRRL